MADGVVVTIILITWSHSSQDPSVNQTQSFGQTNPLAASALVASSPVLPLSALRAKSVALKD